MEIVDVGGRGWRKSGWLLPINCFVSATAPKISNSTLCNLICKSCRPVFRVFDGGEKKIATRRLESQRSWLGVSLVHCWRGFKIMLFIYGKFNNLSRS